MLPQSITYPVYPTTEKVDQAVNRPIVQIAYSYVPVHHLGRDLEGIHGSRGLFSAQSSIVLRPPLGIQQRPPDLQFRIWVQLPNCTG